MVGLARLSIFCALCHRIPSTDCAHPSLDRQETLIVGTRMQPYEAHIPYLLQFTSDYNISPMGWLHLAKCEVSMCIHRAVVCARDQHTSSHRMQPRLGAEDQLRLHAVKAKTSHGIAAS